MKIEETVICKVRKDTGIKCDSCGKTEKFNSSMTNRCPDGWHNFTVYMKDEYLQIEEEYDVCSIDCYLNMLEHGLIKWNQEEPRIGDMNFDFANNLFQRLTLNT